MSGSGSGFTRHCWEENKKQEELKRVGVGKVDNEKK